MSVGAVDAVAGLSLSALRAERGAEGAAVALAEPAEASDKDSTAAEIFAESPPCTSTGTAGSLFDFSMTEAVPKRKIDKIHWNNEQKKGYSVRTCSPLDRVSGLQPVHNVLHLCGLLGGTARSVRLYQQRIRDGLIVQ